MRLKGVHAPHLKKTAGMEAVDIPLPKLVRIPMSMHIGAPAKPVVSVGDNVMVGQLIGEAGGFVSAQVHSSVSGKVVAIDVVDEFTGLKAVSISIESDGKQTLHESVVSHNVTSIEEFLDAVKNCGAVGLGGAGFPTAVKLTIQESANLDYIIINGAECEPYITSDTRTMIDDAELMRDGIGLLKKFFDATIYIGIENNKPEAIKKMQELADGEQNVEVKVLPAMYPQGGEKVLIYNTTGRIVPEGGLPLDVGVIVLNCTTLAAIARYIDSGMPIVSKRVTVDGSAVANPKNLIAPIGTPVGELLDFCGCDRETVKKALYGGPMMGLAIHSLEMPVLKNTNAVLAFTEKDAKTPVQTACIKCGRCASNCPMRLMALELERAYLLNKPEMLEHFKVNLCMECGCCAYNCPAKRPLIQSIKLGKIMLREYLAKQEEISKGGGDSDE